MKGWLRRVRGLLGNSVLWGVAWFAGSTAILGTMLVLGILPRSNWSWEIILEQTRWIGMAGFGAGVVFSAALPLLFRGRLLSEVKAGRFVLGGAALGGLTFFGAMNLLVHGTIHPSPFLFAGIAAVFGGATAGASLAAAKHAHRLEVNDALESLESTQEEAGRLLRPEST